MVCRSLLGAGLDSSQGHPKLHFPHCLRHWKMSLLRRDCTESPSRGLLRNAKSEYVFPLGKKYWPKAQYLFDCRQGRHMQVSMLGVPSSSLLDLLWCSSSFPRILECFIGCHSTVTGNSWQSLTCKHSRCSNKNTCKSRGLTAADMALRYQDQTPGTETFTSSV